MVVGWGSAWIGGGHKGVAGMIRVQWGQKWCACGVSGGGGDSE